MKIVYLNLPQKKIISYFLGKLNTMKAILIVSLFTFCFLPYTIGHINGVETSSEIFFDDTCSFYVSTTGSDNGSGSKEEPFKTISKASEVTFFYGFYN